MRPAMASRNYSFTPERAGYRLSVNGGDKVGIQGQRLLAGWREGYRLKALPG